MESAKGEEFAAKNEMVYIETSAIATKNVKEAFLTLLQAADLSAAGSAAGQTDRVADKFQISACPFT